MSLADDIIKRKIKQPTVAKGNVADMILNNQIQAGSYPSPAPKSLSIPNLNFASRNQNTGSYASQSKITNPEINYYETKYRQEIENRDKLQEAIKNNLKNQGVAVTVDPFSTNRINTTEQIPMNAIQNQIFEAINPYENLKADVENKQKYNEIKQTKEYKNQMEQLREASNKVAYAKYDLDAARVANDDIGWYDKTIGNVLGGAGSILDFSSGIVKNENGDIAYLPNISQMKHQKVQESYDTGIGRFLGEAGYNVGRIGGSTLLNAVVPYAGSTAYFGKMFQENRDNAILEGYDGGDATIYALANVTGEVITGKLLGSATKGLTGGKTSGYEELLGKLVGKFTQNPLIISFLAGAGSEATEEFIQEYADNLMKLALLDKSTNGKDYLDLLTNTDILSDAAYSAAMGALTGGLMNPFQVDSNTQQSAFDEFKQQLIERRENAQTEAEVKAIDNTIEKIDELSNKSEELIDLAKEKGLVQEEQPQATETKIEEQSQEAKIEETASKEETTSEVASKEETKQEEPPKAKTSKPLNFREALTNYEVEDILQQINTYNQEQIEKNLITTERVKESYNNNKINLAYATLVMKSNNASDFSQTRAEQYFKKLSKELSDTDKIYVYRNLDKTNSKLAEIAEKYFAPTKQQEATETAYEIKESTEPKKKGQLQFDIKEEAKKANIPAKQTAKIIETNETVERVQSNENPVENMSDSNITYTKDGIQTTFNEKVADDVLKIEAPNEKPQTITLTDGKETIKVRKPSAELNEKGLDAIIEKYGGENLTDDEKKLVKQEIQQKHRDFTNAKKFAVETKNKDMLKFLNQIEEQEIYNQIDVSSQLFKEILKAAEDIDDYTEKFNVSYLNDTVGSKDETPTNVNYDTIAKGQAIMFYQIQNNNMEEAMDALIKVKRYGTTASQALNQMKAMYQNTEFGIYLEAQNAMDDAYKSFAKRKTQKWRDKNNPAKNPNSKFKFTEEDLKIIQKGSSELYKLHETNYEEYCKKKGELQQFIADRIPKGVGEQITNWVRSALLLAPRTVIKNAGSNVIDTSYHALNKANYSVANKLINKRYGSDITVAGISLDGIREGSKAYFKTSAETARIAFNNLIHKTSVSTEYSNKYSSGETSRDNVTKDFYNTMPSRYQGKFKKLNDLGNVLSQLSHDAMGWGDAKFQAQSYADNRLTLRLKNAYTQQRKTGKNVIYDFTTDDAGTVHLSYIGEEGKFSYAITNTLDDFLEGNKNFKMLDNMKEIDDLALKYSESRTYVGDTTFSKATSTFLNAIDSGLNKLPVVRGMGIKPTSFIVPFSKIGSNLCYKMYRGSVLSIPSINKAMAQFKTELADAKKNGGKVSYKTQYEVVSRVGDLMTGTMIYMFVGSLAKAAFDNVEGDDDDDESTKVSKFMKTVFGKDKYTFKVGDYNFSFDVGGNLTNMLKMSLDLKELGEQEDKDVKDYIDTALGDILSEWTLNNLAEVFDTQYDDTITGNILQTIARIPSMAIPNFMKDVSTHIDNFTQRSVWDEDIGTYAINSIKSKIPFARGTLPEKLDSWGNTMKAGDTLITSVWNTYIVSDQIKKDNSDPVSQELMQQYLITGKASLLPNVNKSSFTYNKIKYTLTDEEEQQYLKTYAKSAHDNLDKLFYSSVYQDADTETKLKYIDEVYEYANDEAKKEYLNNKNISYYNYGQRVAVIGTNTEFKPATVLDAVDNNISYQSATKYQSDTKKFNYYNSFGSYDKYKAVLDNVDDVRATYSKANGYTDAQRKQKVIDYVNTLNNMSAVQKAILIKEKYPSAYKSYNDQIKAYLKKQNLDDETYNQLLSKLGVK